MKKISQACIFDADPPPFNFEKDGCRYFGRRKVAVSRYFAMPVPFSWSMYCVTGLYEDKILPGCHFRRSNSGFMAIEHIREGSMYVRQDGRMYLAEPGDVVLLHPYCEHEFLTGPEEFCAKTSVLLVGPLLDEMLTKSGLRGKDIIGNLSEYHLDELFKSFKALSFDFGGIAREQVVSLSYKLIQLLLSREAYQSMPEKLSAFISYLDEHLAEHITLEDMAGHYGCSVPHFCRLFTRYCNTSPYHMLVRLRMRAAVRMLLENRLSIKEVAQQVGYESAFNFSTEFKKRFGVSPRNFRQATP